MSAAVAAHQHKVRQVLQEAVDGGFMTEAELERCVEHADGSRWGDTDHSRRERPEATNIDVVWSTYDYNAFSLMDEGLNRGVDHWLTIYFNNPDFDPRRLRRNAIANPSYLYPSATVKDACEMMEKLYNRRCQPVKLKY